MKINKLEDIIVPQIPITENGDWDSEILPILKGFADGEMVSPTSLDDIEKCEKRLGTKLPNDLRLFYLKFGPAILLETLLDVKDFEYLSGSWDKSFINNYSKQEQEIISNLIVFGDYLGNGNLWCFHKDTKYIFYFNHDTRPNINGMFKNFYGYLQPLLLYTQAVMAEHIKGIDQEIEKIVINLIGKDRVRVWQYYTGWE